MDALSLTVIAYFSLKLSYCTRPRICHSVHLLYVLGTSPGSILTPKDITKELPQKERIPPILIRNGIHTHKHTAFMHASHGSHRNALCSQRDMHKAGDRHYLANGASPRSVDVFVSRWPGANGSTGRATFGGTWDSTVVPPLLLWLDYRELI